MSQRSVIFTSDHAWDSPIQISAHHLARQFNADGWRVLFLANPTSPLHLLRAPRSPVVKGKLRSWWKGPQSGKDGVVLYSPFTLLPFSRFWPVNNDYTLSNWHHFTIPSLAGVLKKNGFGSPDLMVVDTVMQAGLIETIGPGRVIYRITDANRYFASSNSYFSAAERRLAQRADLVTYTAQNLEAYTADLAPRQKLHTPHGVDLAHFTESTAGRPPEYADLTGPIALFVGSLEDWVDVSLVVHAAKQMPDINFVLIGPRGAAIEQLEPVPNLTWLGPRPYRDIPAYMRHADIGLIPFDRSRRPELVDAINPIKLYEYFACGLPVVACRTKEMASLEYLLHVYETLAQFIEQVRAAAGNGRNEAGRKFADGMSWPSVYRRMMDTLQDAPPRQ